MKKLLVLLTAFALAVLPACSCNGDPPAEHTHAYSPVVTAPTCGLGGYTTFACICGKTYVDDYTERLGHEYEDGICIRCGSAQPVPHVHDYEKTVVAADCLNGGTVNGVCKICGARYIENLAPLGHSYDNGVCTRCGHFNPELHAHEYTTTVTEPDCINQGYTTYTCACGHSYNENIAPLGHSYDNGVCIRCGALFEKLAFTLSDDGSSYICRGIGNVTDTDITVPSTYKGKPVTAIGNNAFFNTDVTSIIIPDSVTSIGMYAFLSCYSLAEIYLGSNVSEIEESAFSFCSNLTNISVSAENTRYHSQGNCLIETQSKALILWCKNSVIPDDGSVTSINNYAFLAIVDLTGISIPYCVTFIGSYAIYLCVDLASIQVDARNPRYYGIGNCLIDRESNTLILGCKNSVIPDDGSIKAIGENAFKNCRGLTTIIIPDGVTSISDFAFEECTGLSSIVIPDSGNSIGRNAFLGCFNLTDIHIPNGLTVLRFFVFTDCKSIKTVTIPKSVSHIEMFAFSNSGITTIIFDGTVEEWDGILKEENWDANMENYTVRCKNGEIKVT